jgi:uncharacterized membrane protein
MEKETALKAVSIISFIGVLFSGYLSFGTVISGVCPLNGECPFFLGYPACYYGLAMFMITLIASLMSFKPKQDKDNLTKVILVVSFVGVLFAGYFSVGEILNPRNYALILPTCVYALIMYILVFIIPLLGLLKKK